MSEPHIVGTELANEDNDPTGRMRQRVTDFRIENHGTLALLRPLTEAARVWRDAHLRHPETQWMGEAVAIEPRYVDAIVQGIVGDGLTVEVA